MQKLRAAIAGRAEFGGRNLFLELRDPSVRQLGRPPEIALA